MPNTSPAIRFNPHSEDGTLRQVAAGNWELLRRVPACQAVAQQWIASEAFRFAHVSEQKTYPANPQARCALDWMLTPEERYPLAQYQMRHRLFFSDQAANYGPIVMQVHLENQTTRLEELRIGNAFVSGRELSSEELAGLGRYLFQLGGHLRRISLDFKMAAIRCALYSERQLDEILHRIKK